MSTTVHSVLGHLPDDLRRRVIDQQLTLAAANMIAEERRELAKDGIEDTGAGEGSDRAVRPQALEDVYRTVKTLRAEATSLRAVASNLNGLADRLERDVLAAGDREALSGEAIAEVLRTLTHDRTVYHYRDLYGKLLSAGFTCRGEDPQATMLANLSRSPLWEKAGQPRSGEYEWAR